MKHYIMTFTHKYTEITLETLKGKISFLRASLTLFVSFIALKCLQYNIRFQPTSETIIPILELECHGLQNTSSLKKWKKRKRNPKFFSGVLSPNPRIRVVDNGFQDNAQKPIEGALAGYPPVTPPGAGAQRVGLVELGLKLHAKNIT